MYISAAERQDRLLLRFILTFPVFIVLLPFATRVLDAFGSRAVAIEVYALVNTGADLMNGAPWWYASKGHGLIEQGLPRRTVNSMQARGPTSAACPQRRSRRRMLRPTARS
jgi:hypothetical protein